MVSLVKMAPDDSDRPQAVEQILEALRYRHGLADYVVRNRRGPVGGLPDRIPTTYPLVPTEKQAVLVEVGESVMLELVQTIGVPRARNRILGEMLRALWATPRALTEVLEQGGLRATVLRAVRAATARARELGADS